MSLVTTIGLLLIAGLGHGYLWTDAVNRMHAWAGPRKLIDKLTLLCFCAFVLLPPLGLLLWYLGKIFPTGLIELVPDMSAFGIAHGYLYFCMGWGIYSIIINSLRWNATDNPNTLLDWQQETLDTSQLGPEVLRADVAKKLKVLPGNQVFQLTVDRKRLAIPRLGAAHEGLKIAHISDLHMTGRLGPEWYQLVVEQVNRLQADVIVITGDIVEKEACWPWLAESLGKLRARHGVYFVLGNHDYYIDVEETKTLLQAQGLIYVADRWVETKWNGAPVLLAGNERPWGTTADLTDAPVHTDDQLRVMLLHTPDEYQWARQQDADLAFAGHTHGGQLRFPLLGPIACPSRYGIRYACGVFLNGETVMHVSRGLGGKTPLRWNCPPEIALLELTKAK